MSKNWQYISNKRLECPPSANVGSLHISCGYLGNGDFGPTGPTPDGDCYGDYLYWDNTTNSWAVGSEKINLGCGAGQFNQGDKSVAIGYEAGFTGQTLNSVAIGNNAGHYRQGDTGTGNPGNTGNTGNAVAIGNSAGQFDQAANTVAIGNLAGQYEQQQYSVAIGRQSGRYGQNYEAVAIGNLAGNTGQNIYGIAIGSNAGAVNQGKYSIAIGREAGHTGSGQPGQGNYAVAIGYQAGYTNQHNNTIVLNASGNKLNTGATNAFYVKPIRNSPGPNSLYYDDNTGEISYSPPSYNKYNATENINNVDIVYNTIYNLTPGILIEMGTYMVNFYFQANGTIKDGSASNANLKYLNYNLSTLTNGFAGPIGESRVISQVKLSDKAGAAELSYNCSRVLVNDNARIFYLVFQMDFTNLSANDTDPAFKVHSKSYCEVVKIA
jgi:hypothetical protein